MRSGKKDVPQGLKRVCENSLSPRKTAGRSTTLRFGRDDNSVSVSESRPQNQFVIPTEAYPDFLARSPVEAKYAPFRRERRMKFAEATNFHRKSGGA
jgi:hypothetical protein